MIGRMAGHEPIGGESAAREAGWKARVARFYPPRRMAHVVLTVSGSYLAAILALTLLAEYLDLLDMDGHDAVEEPIRAFIYQSLRPLAEPIGIGCLVSIVCFGIAAVALQSEQRTPVLRTDRDPVR
jgi:hypothetical protein